MNATGAVILGRGELSLGSRVKNKVIPTWGLGSVSRLLSTISHTQEVRVKVEAASLKYFNTRMQTWIEVESSKNLAGRLRDSVSELNFSSPFASSQVKAIFRSLIKAPIHILGNQLSEYGIEVKNPSGKTLGIPVSWNDLYEEAVPAAMDFDFDEASKWGKGLAWFLGVAGSIGGCIYGLKGKREQPAWGLGGGAGGAFAGYLLGISLYYAKDFFIWASKRLYHMARFGQDYKLIFEANNGFEVSQKGILRIKSILRRVQKGDLASRLTREIDYAVLKNEILAGGFHWSVEKILVAHPGAPKEDLKTFVGSNDQTVRAVALDRVKNQLSPAEVQNLQNLDKEDVISALLGLNLPHGFFLSYLTGERKVAFSKGGELLKRLFNKIRASLNEDNLAAILNTDLTKAGASDDYYQTVWNHPKTRKEALVAAAIKWFPPELIQKALPLIGEILTDDSIICLYDTKRLETIVHPPDAAHNTLRDALLNHPRASKKVGIHVIKTAQYSSSIAEAAFGRFEKDFVEGDLEELYETVNKRGSWINQLKRRIAAHPNFSRKLRIKVIGEDNDIEARKAALQALGSPTAAELDAIIEANTNVPEMVGMIQSASFTLGRSHLLRLCSSKVAGVAEKAWAELAPLTLSLDEELYLAERGTDWVRAAIAKKSSNRNVCMRALEIGGANVQIAALDRVYNSLTSSEIDALASRSAPSSATLEKLGKHPQITTQSLARVLCNQEIIPKSKKVVDSPERTESELVDDYDNYGSPCGSHYEDRTVPEESHQEYGEADAAKAAAFFNGKDLAFARAVLSILDRSNAALTQAIRAKLLSV